MLLDVTSANTATAGGAKARPASAEASAKRVGDAVRRSAASLSGAKGKDAFDAVANAYECIATTHAGVYVATATAYAGADKDYLSLLPAAPRDPGKSTT